MNNFTIYFGSAIITAQQYAPLWWKISWICT